MSIAVLSEQGCRFTYILYNAYFINFANDATTK